MKTELKAKFLQQLNQQKRDEGFTLIELLVVIIIIGILSAIALPSFLSQANKVRQAEAKNIVGTLNRAQQAYYFENQIFADNVRALGIGVVDSDNYNYSAIAINSTTDAVANKAKSRNDNLKGYAGGVFKTAGKTTLTILCEANSVGVNMPTAPSNASDCGDGLTRMQ